MAGIGLSKPYYAIYNANGGNPTYTAGGLIGKATELTLELEGADANVLYADNAAAESDNQFAGGTLTLSTDDLLPEPMMGILGIVQKAIDADGVTTSTPQWLVYNDEQNIPYVGFGGIIKAKQSGVTKWIALVFTKVQFANPGNNAVTQGETVEWQTKELTATVMRDDSAAHTWQMQSTPLDSEADAEAAIQAALGIKVPSLGSLTVQSAAGTGTGNTKLTVTPTKGSGNSYVYKTAAAVTLPTAYGQVMSDWTAWDGTSTIKATTGQEIGVVEVNGSKGAVAAGKTTVTSAT